jgi:hypothetical protein
MKYLLEKLDKNNILELIILRNHTKICLLEIENLKLIITGSANLRSSNSIEQFIIQENEELFNFYQLYFDENKNFSVINKDIEK